MGHDADMSSFRCFHDFSYGSITRMKERVYAAPGTFAQVGFDVGPGRKASGKIMNVVRRPVSRWNTQDSAISAGLRPADGKNPRRSGERRVMFEAGADASRRAVGGIDGCTTRRMCGASLQKSALREDRNGMLEVWAAGRSHELNWRSNQRVLSGGQDIARVGQGGNVPPNMLQDMLIGRVRVIAGRHALRCVFLRRLEEPHRRCQVPRDMAESYGSVRRGERGMGGTGGLCIVGGLHP